jgi:hypothetical protein
LTHGQQNTSALPVKRTAETISVWQQPADSAASPSSLRFIRTWELYHQQRKYREAVETLKTAVSLKPDLLDAQVFLGIDRYDTDFSGAVGPLEKVRG